MEELDCWHTDLIICPYCGYKDENSWEVSESGIITCAECNKKFFMERDVHVYYSSFKLNKDGKQMALTKTGINYLTNCWNFYKNNLRGILSRNEKPFFICDYHLRQELPEEK